MRLIVDAMGGDHAPDEIVAGAYLGMKRCPGTSLIFTGAEERIRAVLQENGFDPKRVRIVPAETEIAMDENPTVLLREKKNSSMAKGFALLRDGEGDAFLSAGSTGALLMGASSRVYQLKCQGIRRCALGTVLPFETPVLLLDAGANIEVTPEVLCQFAKMGEAYMEGILGVENPRVGLVNNGAEETKGTALYVEAHRLLKEDKSLNFVGNVEGRDIPLGACDVLVCDGFTGNVILKLSEGFSKFVFRSLRTMFTQNGKTKLAAALMNKDISAFKEALTPEKYGGAPLLGTEKLVMKAHGASKREAVMNAVIQACKVYDSGLSEKMKKISEELRIKE